MYNRKLYKIRQQLKLFVLFDDCVCTIRLFNVKVEMLSISLIA